MNLDIMTELVFEERLINDPSGSPTSNWSENKKTLYHRWVCEKRKSKAEQTEQIRKEARENLKKFGGK